MDIVKWRIFHFLTVKKCAAYFTKTIFRSHNIEVIVGECAFTEILFNVHNKQDRELNWIAEREHFSL